MKATLPSGVLAPIENCYIDIPIFNITIPMNILPDISDSKGVSYPDESAIGRATPFKQFANSDSRTISWTCHFMTCQKGDQEKIIQYLRALEACTYPLTSSEYTNGAPYAPPPICKLRCGEQLSTLKADDLCAVMKSYNVKFDTSVPWDEDTLVPYKIDVDLQFEVVYNQASLPGAEQIMSDGV